MRVHRANLGTYAPSFATRAWCDIFGSIDSDCFTPAAPTGIAPGLPVGYDGTTAPSNNTGAVIVPTQAAQQSAIGTTISQVIANDPNVTALNGGAGDNSDPSQPCPVGCSFFGIGCPTVCDPSKLDPGSVTLWLMGGALAIFLVTQAIIGAHHR